MLNKYEELNDSTREYLLLLLEEHITNKEVLKRCKKEIELLYDKGILFIIEYLYYYKMDNKNVKYHLRGMANNLLLLYELGISTINPLKYNLLINH